MRFKVAQWKRRESRLFSLKPFRKRQLTLITCAIIWGERGGGGGGGGEGEISLAARFPEILLVLILRIGGRAFRFRWK